MRDLIDLIARLDEATNLTTTKRVYRGTQRCNPDGFDDTRLGKPTYTDVFGIAYAYAEDDGCVFAYDISPNNPLVIPDSGDPFYGLGEMAEIAHLTPDEVMAMIPQFHELRRSRDDDEDDDGMPIHIGLADFKALSSDEERRELINRCYTGTHEYIDSPIFQAAVARHGFDCLIYRGWFTDEVEYTQPGDSWDGDTALEWRPLVPTIVTLIGEVTPEDFN